MTGHGRLATRGRTDGFPDTIAQLHQDITTAEDAGDTETADRLRKELAAAENAAEQDEQAR